MGRFLTVFVFCTFFSYTSIAGNRVEHITLEEKAAKELGFKASTSKVSFLTETSFRLKFPLKIEGARWVQVTVAMYQNNEYISSVSQTAPNSENRIFYNYNEKLVDEIKVSVHYSDSKVYMVKYDVSAT